MRVNTPVVPTEHAIPPGATLVSTTDLQGRILYCNPAFIEVSGYEREELLGQPHNLIRHPDMPEEAFRDMWETIASGQPWSAPVKNRRKDGSYYWVMANVTPLMEGDRPIGYMSVRTVPSRETVAQAEALYATMREEKAAGRRLHRLAGGRLLRDTPAGRVREALALGVPGRTAFAIGFTGLACFAAGAWVPEGWRWAGAALAVAVAATVGRVTVQALAIAPLERLLRHANRMAAGDLTQRISADRHDLVGRLTRALGQLNVNLQSIVRDARNEVDQMRGVTREIASGNHDLSSRTESQASSLQETAASMEQITGTVKLSAESAAQASSLAGRATEIAQRGSDAVLGVANTMSEITEASRRIAAITQTIDGIAFQTNILALNAAVEAARAGEAGRGFAVVAGEVRALAQRASSASREIKTLIENSVEKVEAGSRQSDAARSTMDEALASVRQVGALVDEISHGAREQLTGISQINEAVSQLDSITQQNAALVEQIAASATSLEGQSDTLAQTVRVFRLDAGEAPGADAVALRREMKRQRGSGAA